MLFKLHKNLLHWFLPPACILCGHHAHHAYDICRPCLRDLPELEQACRRCANVLPENSAEFICGICLKSQPLPYDSTHALFLYQPPIPKLILNLKFQQALTHAQLFGELLAEKIQHTWYQNQALPAAIVPVPLHPQRLRERGFNQALEIARPIAKALQIPLLKHHCARIKPTTAQATLSAKERQQNVRNAFCVTKPILAKHIAVVDDVITTGNTITEFCYTLKQQGVEKIDVWCCARPETAPP